MNDRKSKQDAAPELAAIGDSLRDHLAARFAPIEPRLSNRGGLRQAAVAIVVASAPGETEPCVVLTRRSARLKRHRGQFALPGGRLDDGESDLDAALRELDEELGLTLGPEDQLGRLDDVVTHSGFRIAPLVFWAGAGPALTPDPGEVATVFYVTLRELADPTLIQLRSPAPDAPAVRAANLPAVGGEVYPPTAAMLFQFREIAFYARHTDVAGFIQPDFAHR